MCVSAKKLYDIIKLLPRTDVFFATEAASFSVKIAAGKSNFKIAGVGRESFPETIKNGGIKTTLPGDMLRAFIKHTNCCMSGE